MIDKQVATIEEAISRVRSGSTVLVGGFGDIGVPLRLIDALLATDVRDLTIVANNAGTGEKGLALLFKHGRVSKLIASFPQQAGADYFHREYSDGKVEVEIVPQGTLAERLRAGGAGIAGFFTPTAYGTEIAAGKETRMIDGKGFVYERGLRGDFAFVKAHKADRFGNLRYRLASRNFNPVMATAADHTIVEVESVVPLGAIDPDDVHTPGIYVDAFVGAKRMSEIQRGWSDTQLAARIADDLTEGMCVNLGIGLPTTIALYVPPEREVLIHSENGIVGMGPAPEKGQEDWDIVNASKGPVTLITGASIVGHPDSFAIIRGGKIDVSILGGLQVATNGDLANWKVPEAKGAGGVGGAMDLVAGAKHVWVMMRHVDKHGRSKLMEACTFPLTGLHCVSVVYTDLGVFEIRSGKFFVRELAPGVSEDNARAATAAPLEFGVPA